MLADKSDVPPRMVSPVVPEAAVRRRRLDDALTRGAGELATLVCAGPGWGKTLAVASWLSGRSAVGGAWLTLDADDNDLRTFWSDVLLSLTTAGVLPAESGLSQLASGGEFGAAEVRRVRAGLAELPDPVVLVLDDVHLLTDLRVLESMDGLLEMPSLSVRFVLISRADRHAVITICHRVCTQCDSVVRRSRSTVTNSDRVLT